MRAFIVQGTGESTGCRLMTDILIKCGAIGTSGHTQEFQSYINKYDLFIPWLQSKRYDNFVCRFSYPHGNQFIQLDKLYNALRVVYHEVHIILTTRSWICQEIGTINGGHLKNNPIPTLTTAHKRVVNAYKYIFYGLNKIDNGKFENYTIINMGDLIKHPEAHIQYITKACHLTIPENFDYSFIRDADSPRITEYFKNELI
jgi:hypothetical protein